MSGQGARAALTEALLKTRGRRERSRASSSSRFTMMSTFVWASTQSSVCKHHSPMLSAGLQLLMIQEASALDSQLFPHLHGPSYSLQSASKHTRMFSAGINLLGVSAQVSACKDHTPHVPSSEPELRMLMFQDAALSRFRMMRTVVWASTQSSVCRHHIVIFNPLGSDVLRVKQVRCLRTSFHTPGCSDLIPYMFQGEASAKKQPSVRYRMESCGSWPCLLTTWM